MLRAYKTLAFSATTLAMAPTRVHFFVGDVSVGDREIERGTLIHCCLHPDSSTMALNNPLYQRQANAGSFIFRSAVQSMKNPEQIPGEAHVETGSVIPDKINFFFCLPLMAYLHVRVLSVSSKFERV